MAHQLEIWIADQVGDVGFPAREKIVDTHNLMAVAKQTITEIRTEKAGAAGDKNTHKGNKVTP